MTLVNTAKSLIVLASLAVVPAAFGAGDTLTPDEVQHTGISSAPNNDSGVFVGFGGTFGQARTTDDGDPGTAVWGQIEPGFQAGTGSWSRFEASVELFGGTANYRLADTSSLGGDVRLAGLYGAMAKVGYGYSLGHEMFGLLKAGVGPAFATYKVDLNKSLGTAKSDALSGLAWTVGWELVAPMNSVLDFTVGVSWTQLQFDVSNVKLNGTTYPVDRTMLANVPAADIGIRIRL